MTDLIPYIASGLAWLIIVSVLWHQDSVKANSEERVMRRDGKL